MDNNPNEPTSGSAVPSEPVAQPEVTAPPVADQPASAPSAPLAPEPVDQPASAPFAPLAPEPVVSGTIDPQPTDTPTTQPSVVGGVVSTAPVSSGGGKRFNLSKLSAPKLLVPILAAVVLLGGSAAAYFGYYVPNKPENIWHSALVNSGKGYDKLTAYATANKYAKGWSETGSFKFTGPVVADGTLNGKSDGQSGDFSGSLSASGLKVGVDVRSFKSTGDTPDIYFKVDGLQGLGSLLGGGDPSVSSVFNGLNGQWYVVDHTFFEQYAKGVNTNMQVTSADVSSVLNAIGNASKQYVFTADDKKAVVVVKQRIGKEKLGNRSTYHYKVGVNKQNLKTYIGALCTDLQSSKLSKLLPADTSIKDSSSCIDMQKSVDGLNGSETADAWVDTHTKLIRDIRFYDKTNHNNYFDIGQDYQGGTTFPFIIASHSKDGDTTTDFALNLNLDTAANSFKLAGQFKSSGQDGENGTVEMTIAPNNEAVKVDKPAGAKTIIQLLDDLGLGQLLSGATGSTSSQPASNSNISVSSKSRNSERQSDMNALQTQLEAFFAQNGYYPSLTDMNSATWRAANMKSLDPSALTDPQGTGTTLASAPAAKVYAYQVTNADGTSCEKDDTTCAQYTLTATLEGGGTYAKSNLD